MIIGVVFPDYTGERGLFTLPESIRICWELIITNALLFHLSLYGVNLSYQKCTMSYARNGLVFSMFLYICTLLKIDI